MLETPSSTVIVKSAGLHRLAGELKVGSPSGKRIEIHVGYTAGVREIRKRGDAPQLSFFILSYESCRL